MALSLFDGFHGNSSASGIPYTAATFFEDKNVRYASGTPLELGSKRFSSFSNFPFYLLPNLASYITDRDWSTCRGLHDAVNDLFEKHAEKVYRFAISLSRDVHRAEDLTQETFLRAWRSASTLKDPSSEKAWLFQILVNVWRDSLRKKKIEISEADDFDPPDMRVSAEQLAIQSEQSQIIFDAMSKLPDQQRNVLHLRAVEQFTISEIAELLGSNAAAVKANLSVARKKIREVVSRKAVDSEATA